MVSTTVIGDVTRKLSGSVVDPPPTPPGKGNPGGKKKGGGNRSPFELAIQALNPTVNYRFRDGNFKTRIRDYAGSNHLTKQIAVVSRSSVPTRTTHPGGAHFDAVSSANWASQGQFYKGATGLLNGASTYTMLVSMRVIAQGDQDQTYFGIGTESLSVSGDNHIATFKEDSSGVLDFYHRTSTGNDTLTTGVTGRIDDGVNRLFVLRSSGGAQTLYSTKPGHKMLTEDTASQGALDTLNRAILMNAQDNTTDNPSPEYVLDTAAIWDGTAPSVSEITDLSDKWYDELGGYYPAMMQFDGSTGYYSKASVTTSGNKVTAVIRFNRASFTGDKFERMFAVLGGSYQRVQIYCFSSDYSDSDRAGKIQIFSNNTSNVALCALVSPSGYLDGEDHLLFYSFDGDAGTATFRIDGDDADDTGHGNRTAPTTGTLDSGASSSAGSGADPSGNNKFGGSLGMVGYRDAYLTNYSDFGTGDSPAAIDEKNWTEWGAQPLFWSHTGELSNNKGSAGDMTANGTITMTEGGSP